MNKEFSKEFMEGIVELLRMCDEQNEDSVTLTFEIGENKLQMDIVFTVL